MHVRLEPSMSVVVVASGAPPPPVTDNEFIPEDRDLSECITALPKPGCGSEARSDWHQGLVLALLVAGLFVIGWRIVHGVRRRPVQSAPAEPTRDDITTDDITTDAP